MMLNALRKLARWRRPALVLGAFAFEAWMLLTPDLTMDGVVFPLLCALTCWVPAWLCGDLLSIHTRDNPEPHREWAPREFLLRARSRLSGYFPTLFVWVGTWTARALWEDMKANNRGPFGIALAGSHGQEFIAWLAWTLVFLASALAYAAGAAMLSTLCRRPRRWLLVPLLVIVMGFSATAIIEWLVPPKFSSITASLIADPRSGWHLLLVSPNYVMGASTAFAVGQKLDQLPEPAKEAVSRALGQGIAPFSWIATCFFLLLTAGAVGITWIVAVRRYRRHPYTVARDAAAPVVEASSVSSERLAPPAAAEETEQCLSA